MKHILSMIAILLALAPAYGAGLQQVRFHNEATDTTRINEMLTTVEAMQLTSPGQRMVALGKLLLGTPYVAHTLEGEPEMVTVNIDQLDCTTFVETVLAMSLTLGERRSSWRDFVYNLERVRYRGGKCDGYPSRLHYIADWASNNIFRGTLKEGTTRFPRYNTMKKTLDFMTTHADKYPALADSANLARMKMVEEGYRQHLIYYIKSIDINSKPIKEAFDDGDIVAFVTKTDGLDVSHLGIVVKIDGTPYLMHASSSNGKVEITKISLAEYLKRNRNLLGVRVLRIGE